MAAAGKKGVSRYTTILIAGLALLALVSLGRAVQFTFLSELGGIDFHSYWYSGLFVRQGRDPYAAYFERARPQAPVTYLDGTADSARDLRRGLPRIPANTAPLVLILSLFSWLPWETARLAWFLVNLLLAGLLPWLVIRGLAPEPPLPRTVVVVTCLLFYALKSTRGALGTGQTTLIVFAAMVLALIAWRRSWLAAGLLLGIALSKYSLALPAFFFFLYKRQFKLLIVSLLVQLAGLLVIAAAGGSSPLAILGSYWRIMVAHLDRPGIHLTQLFPAAPALQVILPLLLTAVVLLLIIRQIRRDGAGFGADVDNKFTDLHLLSALALWTLLVAYHRPYDGVIMLFFIVMMMVGLVQPERWRLAASQRTAVTVYFFIVMAFMIAPYEEIGAFLPGIELTSVLELVAKAVILSLVSMLALTFWLWQRAAEG